MPINFNEVEIGAVPIPINFNLVENGAVPATILKRKMKARTVRVNHLRNQVLDKDSAGGPRACALS